MGSISSDGNIVQEYNVDNCTWNATVHRYEIALTGIGFNYLYYPTLISLIAGPGATADVSANAGYLYVYVYDSGGNPVQNPFCFTVLDYHP